MNIRPATLEDLSTLLLFEQGVIAAERPMDITLKERDVKYYDIQELIQAPYIQLLVAEIKGKIVGSAYARIQKALDYLKHDRYAYLGFMYVEPSYRGQGINGLLIKRLKEWCHSKEIFELRLKVYNQNPGATKAYEKVGFSNHLIEMRLDLLNQD